MRRRDTLRNCAVLGATGGLSLLGGCSAGGDDGPSASLAVSTIDYRAGEDGSLVVAVAVENAGEAAGSGTLYLTVTAATAESGTETDADGEVATDASRETVSVTVPAGETETVTATFEFTVEQFERKGSIDADVRT